MAQISLGFMYEEGKGVVQDDAEARKWATLAEAQYQKHSELRDTIAEKLTRGNTIIYLLAIVISLGSITWAFFSPMWAWSPLLVAAVYLLVNLFGVKKWKWHYVEELSPSANQMIQKFGHYYAMPLADRDLSSAASTIQLSGCAVGIIGAAKGFWWGLAIATVFYLSVHVIAVYFNPTLFLKDPEMKNAHDEVISWLTQQSEKDLERAREKSQ